jgi:hypothetical protein
MFISRLIILYAARKLKRIAKLINQPMQRASKVHKLNDGGLQSCLNTMFTQYCKRKFPREALSWK